MIEEQAGETALMGPDAISFIHQTVTVRQGKQESQEMIRFKLNENSESLKAMGKSGMVSLVLTTQDPVKISDRFNSYVWKVNKEITNINADGDLKDKTMIAVTEYDVLAPPYGWETDDVSDNVMDTYTEHTIGQPSADLSIQLKETKAIAGLSLTPSGGGWGLWNLSCKTVEVLGGDNTGVENQVRIGIATCTTGIPSDNIPWAIAFYSPVKVKYLTVRVLENFATDGTLKTWIAEMRLYE